MSERGADVIKTLMGMGVMATINHTLDQDTAILVIEEMGHIARLFDAEAPREQGAFARVGLRVSDVAAAREQLPEGTPETFDAGGGVMITLVEAPTDVEYDLDHVTLYSADPEATAAEYRRYGFEAEIITRAGWAGCAAVVKVHTRIFCASS